MRYFGVHEGSHDAGLAVLSQDGQLVCAVTRERLSRVKHDPGPVLGMTGLPRPAPGDVVLRVGPGGVGHHHAHIAASWMYRGDDEPRRYLAYDGCGPTEHGRLIASLVGEIGPGGISAGEPDVIESSAPLCKPLGFGGAGKLMGLAGYHPREPARDLWFPRLRRNPRRLAGYYRYWIEEIWAGIEPLLTGPVVIGGGTTLALELNTRIWQRVGHPVFGPGADDSGLALGAAAVAFHRHTGRWPAPLGTAAVLGALVEPCGPQDPADLACLLLRAGMVGLVRGKAELGPRALGHRSILALPRADMLQRLSVEIKGREYYRPLAPVVTDRQFDRFFRGPRGRYMQYRCEATAEAARFAPAIVHRDGSSRPQVVRPEEDPWLHDLLQEVGYLTGHEILVNTSLNRAGSPICHTVEDAVRELGHALPIVGLTGT